MDDSFDLSLALHSFSETYFGTPGDQIVNTIGLDRLTQEIRLSAPLGEKFDGLLGVFDSHEDDYWKWHYPASDPFTGAQLGDWGTFNPYNAPIVYDEFSVFGDLTYHVTDQFDVQIGGRESWLKNIVDPATATGLLATVIYGAPTSPYIFPGTTLNENDFTYLLTPRFKISPDFMVYARLASGYRPGGVNIGMLHVPQEYSSDKSKDYEIGAKAEFLDHTLSVDGSVYYIDWKNIQLPLIYPVNGSTYVGNAAGPKVREWNCRPIKAGKRPYDRRMGHLERCCVDTNCPGGWTLPAKSTAFMATGYRTLLASPATCHWTTTFRLRPTSRVLWEAR